MYQLNELTNGSRVLTAYLPGRSSAAIGIWAKVGGRYESKAQSGISHFLEHMLFKGTKNRSTRKIKADVEGVGGMLNAFTGEELTCYFVKVPARHTHKAFDVLQDMANDATLDQREHDKERTVILEEIKMYLDLPSHHVHELMGELLWPEQALGRPLAGTHASVSRLSAKDLQKYKERYYHSRNLLISFCGDVRHDEICSLAESAFAKNPSKEASKFKSALSTQSKQRFFMINKKTEQMHFVIGFHGLPRHHADRYKLAILNVILGANMSSRLFEEVREKRGLAYEIRSGLSFFEDAGAVTISAGVEPKKAALSVQVIMRELKKLKNTLVKPDELRRAKDYFLGQFLLGLEDTLDHMLWIGDRMMYRNDLPDMKKIEQNVENVTSDDVQALAQKLFKSNAVNFSLIGSYDPAFEKQIKGACDCE